MPDPRSGNFPEREKVQNFTHHLEAKRDFAAGERYWGSLFRSLFIWDPMAVNPHGDLWVCMTKLVADVEDVRPIAQELACERAILKSDVSKTRLAQNSLEVTSLHVVHIQETALAVGEHPLRDFILTLFHRLFLYPPAKVAQAWSD